MTFVKLLYGSRARGEADSLSDTDVLIVCDHLDTADYSWSEIDKLGEYGSLFLWHLHLEARVLDADEPGRARWENATSGLPPYSRVASDLEAFRTVLDDVLCSLNQSDADPEFEGGVLARTIRHAAILACFLVGEPNFSRYGAVARAMEIFDLPTPRTARFEDLYDLVLRPGSVSAPAVSTLSEWVQVGAELVSNMRGMEVSYMETDRIVGRLDELLDTLGDPKAAYVVRSRLDRVLLMTRCYLDEPGVGDGRTVRLQNALRRIEDSFRALRRRSEPFGDGWLHKLAVTRDDLLALREELLSP